MRISDWSSDVCSSDLKWKTPMLVITGEKDFRIPYSQGLAAFTALQRRGVPSQLLVFPDENHWVLKGANSVQWHRTVFRSEEHTSELQSLMRISYAVFCLKKKNQQIHNNIRT